MTDRNDPISTTLVRAMLGPITLSDQELHDFILAVHSRTTQAIRVHPDVSADGLPWDLTQIPWFSRGYWPPVDARPSRHLPYATGDYYIQDAGSLLAVAACELRPGMTVCDLCAAPGGKASAIAEQIGADGWLLANEPIQSRIAPLAYNLARTGTDRWVVSSQDPDVLADLCAGMFDRVLVDAPCSGQALLGRQRQRASALGEKQIQHSAARQRRILEAAVKLLAPDGQLVYSTCTFADAENEAHAAWLDETFPWLKASPCPALESYRSPVATACYRLWPHRDRCSGAFVMRRRNSELDEKPGRKRPWKHPRFEAAKRFADLEDWGHLDGQAFFRDKSRWFAWPDSIDRRLVALAVAGPEIAHLVGATWQPSHALALRTAAGWVANQTVDFSEQDAVAFARGEPVSFDRQGWQCTRWSARPLGWGKASQGVLKNQIPHFARTTIE